MSKKNIDLYVADAFSESDTRKKIYITSLHLKHGGVEMVISLLANAFIEKGYDVEILCVYRLGEPAYFFDERVKITYLTDVHPNREEFAAAIASKNPFKVIKEVFYAFKVLHLKKKSIKKAVSKIDSGIVISTRHEHSVLLSQYGNANVLKIAQLHSDHKFDKKLLDDFKTKYSNIDYFALLTPGTTEEIKNVMQGSNGYTKCVTVPNFIENLPQETDIVRNNQVVAVGRFSPEKGFSRLLDVWEVFLAKHPDWTLKIIGDGDEREALIAKARALRIHENVVFTGMLPHDKVLEEMFSSKIYAMSSYTEALPMVIIEAAACGLPAVAFDVRVGPKALIDDSESGLLIADNDINAFAAALEELAENEEKRAKMGNSAREKALNYTKDNIIELWLDIFNGKEMG